MLSLAQEMALHGNQEDCLKGKPVPVLMVIFGVEVVGCYSMWPTSGQSLLSCRVTLMVFLGIMHCVSCSRHSLTWFWNSLAGLLFILKSPLEISA